MPIVKGRPYIGSMFKLPEITYPLSIDTIGKVIATGGEIDVNCFTNGCHHHGRINLVALARRVGMDHSCMAGDLKRFYYCQKCRAAGREGKNIGFIARSATDPQSPWPRQKSAYEKAKGG